MNHSHKSSAGNSSRFNTAHKMKGFEMQTLFEDPPDTPSDEQPLSTGSFHRQIAASIIQHHRYVDRACRSLQPVSPASSSSSMELTRYNQAITPTSSLDYYKGKRGDSSLSLKTSTELLKVLNHIWCLEEQHTSNMSLVKGLKMELNNARMRIKELLQEKLMDQQVINDLMNQVSEQDRVREELEGVRKLRKRSESLHRKLAREISEVKSSFSNALNELERERRSRVLLEDLCDEFAMGIREYEQEVRSLKLKTDKEKVQRDDLDSLVLHISEAWLDERMQMKLPNNQETRKINVGENGMIVDKLRPEIEAFLKARETNLDTKENFDMTKKNSKGGPLYVDEEDDDDSIDSDMHCFDLNKNLNGEFSDGTDHKENLDHSKGRTLEDYKGKIDAVNISETKEFEEVDNGGSFDKQMVRTQNPAEHERNRVLDKLLRTNSSSIEGERVHPESDFARVLLVGPDQSPVKKSEQKIISRDSGNRESSSRWSRDFKGNTLKAKLLEARLEGRKYSRCKGS